MKPRVLICGLHAQQIRAVQEGVKREDVDLRFIGTDQGPKHWGNAAQRAKIVIAVTKFLSHRHTDQLPRDRTVLHRGGVSGVIDLVNQLDLDTPLNGASNGTAHRA